MMLTTLRKAALAGFMALGLTALGTGAARAQGYPGYGYGQSYGAYGTPGRYYGNGGYDYQPHWHTTQTPFGGFSRSGSGAHDLQPHEHSNTPYGGYRGYSPSPFGGMTTSYYNSTPYMYMPW